MKSYRKIIYKFIFLSVNCPSVLRQQFFRGGQLAQHFSRPFVRPRSNPSFLPFSFIFFKGRKPVAERLANKSRDSVSTKRQSTQNDASPLQHLCPEGTATNKPGRNRIVTTIGLIKFYCGMGLLCRGG